MYKIQGSKVRVIWGCVFSVVVLIIFWGGVDGFVVVCRRVTRPHGSSGVVKSKFRVNLPPRAFGASVRVVRAFPPSFLTSVTEKYYLTDALSVYDLIHTPFCIYTRTPLQAHMTCPYRSAMRRKKYQPICFGGARHPALMSVCSCGTFV